MHRAPYVVARLIAVVLSVIFPVASRAQTPWPPSPTEISSAWDGMCLQPINKSMEPGAAIVQEACTGLPEQMWFWIFSNDVNEINGVAHLRNSLSGLCL